MTRWAEEFNKNPFKNSWSTLLEAVAKLDVDDQTVVTTVEELARLKKAIAFVDAIISNVDLELTPKSVWSNCASQTDACLQQVSAYASKRDKAYLVQANEHADNLLTYVRPYMVVPEDALGAYGTAVRAFEAQVTDHVKSFHENASQTRDEIAQALRDVRGQKKKIDAAEQRVKRFDDYLFEGIDGNDAVEVYVKKTVEEIKKFHEEIHALYDSLLVGEESISSKIKIYEDQIQQTRDTLTDVLSSARSEYKELGNFYNRVFGEQAVPGTDIREGGLKQELDLRMKQLDDFEEAQRTRHDALFGQIESLLPGATSAGLASAYKALKDAFKDPIKKYTLAFYVSLVVLLFGGIALVSDVVTLWPFKLQFVQARDWEEMLRTLLARAPIIVPIVWLALFSATRRSQYERLQQEYAHKEALASSYESYKKQLQDLKVDSDVLQKELIAKAIEAIAYNASMTLDGNHAEKPPVFQVFEKLSWSCPCNSGHADTVRLMTPHYA